MSYDCEDGDDHRLRDLLEQSRRAVNSHDEIPDDDLLYVRPQPKFKKKQKPKREE